MKSSSILLAGLNHVYQLPESAQPSDLEKDQRRKFDRFIKELLEGFQPTIIADEEEYTSDKLRSLFQVRRVFVDIPHEVRSIRGLYVRRACDRRESSTFESLCAFMDGEREKYWQSEIEAAINNQDDARVFMLCGANHLYPHRIKPSSFPAALEAAGYSVKIFDLTKEKWWNDTWLPDWKWPGKDPRPIAPISPDCCLAWKSDICSRLL